MSLYTGKMLLWIFSNRASWGVFFVVVMECPFIYGQLACGPMTCYHMVVAGEACGACCPEPLGS